MTVRTDASRCKPNAESSCHPPNAMFPNLAFISSLHADWPRSGLVRRKSKDFFKILTDSDAVLL